MKVREWSGEFWVYEKEGCFCLKEENVSAASDMWMLVCVLTPPIRMGRPDNEPTEV